MGYKLPYLLGGGTTDNLEQATTSHVICLVDMFDAISTTKRLLAVAVDEIDFHEDSEELILRVRVLLDCLRSRLDSELEALNDSIQMLREFYPSIDRERGVK